MSAIGPKRTSLIAPHVSAFGGKADVVGEKADVRKFPFMALSLVQLLKQDDGNLFHQTATPVCDTSDSPSAFMDQCAVNLLRP
jgi:hypothetical protein